MSGTPPERPDPYARFASIGFDDFRAMARDESLSRYEKIGFPDSYRAGFEAAILDDVRAKLPAIDAGGRTVLDVGCGCSDLPRLLIERCESAGNRLLMVDSAEMLALLPPSPRVEPHAAYFPRCPELVERWVGRVDAILAYSVIQYVFAEGNLWEFVDVALSLLAPGGRLLLGDVPNLSRRKRFFASETGVRHHRRFTGTDETPEVVFNRPEPHSIDDAVVFGLLMRARAAGFDAWIVPQAPGLPMANRREDILIERP